MKKTVKYKSITRLDTDSTHGWWVRVYFKGKIYTKLFSDSLFDDGQHALEEAIKWRNQKEEELDKPRSESYVMLKRKSNTGFPGIHRIVRKTNKKGKEYIEDVYYIHGKSKYTTVSVTKWGESEGIKRALEIHSKIS